MKNILAAVTAIGILTLSACAHGPTTADISKAINASLAGTNDCIASPISQASTQSGPFGGGQSSQSTDAQDAALAHVGLLRKIVTYQTGIGMWGATYRQAIATYRLSPTGEDYVTDGGKLCYGHDAVGAVRDFTTDSDTATTAHYTYKVANLAKWATHSDVRMAFPNLDEHLAGSQHRICTAKIAKANTGWSVQSDSCHSDPKESD